MLAATEGIDERTGLIPHQIQKKKQSYVDKSL
jgi:hypothetical protein